MILVSRFTPNDLDSLRVMGLLDKCRVEIILGVARRCSYGAPQVLLCAAEKDARPFPTTFWLICPHLVKTAGRLESENGVSSMESSLSGKDEEWARYSLAHAMLRLETLRGARKAFLRRYARGMYSSIRRGGVGGIADVANHRVKCVHLQLASYLGMGYHPASVWIASHLPRLECGEGSCLLK